MDTKHQATATTKFHTGDITENGHDFAGLMDEIRIYNRVLSASEVAALSGQQLAAPQVLTLNIADDWVWEDGGTTTATILRAGNLAEPVEIYLASSDPAQATIQPAVTMAAGQSQAEVTITAPIDSIRSRDHLCTTKLLN